MRLSEERIQSLRILLREKHGMELTDEQAQQVGLAIIRFVIAKAQRKQELAKYKEHEHEQPNTSER